MLKLLPRPSSIQQPTRPLLHIRPPLRPISISFQPTRLSSTISDPSEEEISATRQWLSKFDGETIPKRLTEVSFSRSSGPGGQNVNKVSSKATMRLPLESLLPLLPPLMHAPLRQSRYYAKNGNALVIQADDSRKQVDNAHLCFVRLHQLLTEIGESVVPGETSERQKKRVQNLQQRDNEVRIKMKKVHSNKKASRRSGRGDD